MAHLEVRRTVAAPPERVWDIIADLEHQARWMVDVRQLEIVSAQKSGVGTVLHVRSELFGLRVVRDVMEITAWQPPHRMDVLHRGQFHGIGQFLLEQVDGGTMFTWIEDFQPPLGPLGEAAFAVVVRPHLRRVFSRSMANVARLAEPT
jgi:uncharacterized protein YndB with AHSA1/START domain